jgi:DNA replication protein DnaC
MNNNQTIEKLRQMRIGAMAELHLQHVKNNGTENFTSDEYLGMLTDHEWESRQNQKTERLLNQANFRQKASVEDIRFEPVRNLDRNMFTRLATLDFIRRKENILITGASGVGKSYLAQALGHQACFNGYKVLHANTARLFTRLKLAKTDGTYLKELQKLQKTNLLILDDFGLQALDNHSREALMDIIDERYDRTSTIIVSQIPVSIWYDLIGESTIADAILDRIVNSSHRIDLKGESLRKGILKN